MSLTRRGFLAGTCLTALAGCLGHTSEGSRETTASSGSSGTTESSTSGGSGDPGAIPTAASQLPLLGSPETIRDAAQSGGPPKDGIPSIDEPSFVDPEAVDFLDPGDPVFGVARDGVVKAYPQKILVHHEVANDELAGTPVAVTYCPLTGTVQGFERGGTTFGVSGRLINSNLVMYDRATETWWPQLLATSIPGPWNEDPEIRSLREFRLVWTNWAQWREHNPDTRVLSTDTGHAKNYGRDPYGSYNPRRGYYENGRLLFPALNPDDRYEPKRVVMGMRTPDGAAAFLKDALADAGLATGEIGDTPVLAVSDDRYDTAYGYLNPEGAAYERADGAVVGPDGSRHPPDDLPLTRVHTFDAMWFAWAGYYPETNVYE